jgi:hypothetical protein
MTVIFKKILPSHTKLICLFLPALAGGVFLWAQPAYANRLYSTGFELNSLTDGIEFNTGPVAGLSIVTSPARSGTYALQQNSASAGYIRHDWLSANADARVFIRFYFRVATLHTSGTATLLDIKDSSSATRASIRMNSSGNLQLFNATTQVGSNSFALSTGTWYMVEIEFNSLRAAGSDTLKARLNGTTFAASSAETLSTVQRFWLGNCVGTTGAPDFYFDDVAINDINGESNSFPGPGKIVHLRPNASGDYSQDSSSPASQTEYTVVDEETPNDATDYWLITTTAGILDVNIESPATKGIKGNDKVSLVQVGGRMEGTASGSAVPEFRIKSQASGVVLSGVATCNNSGWVTNNQTVPRNYMLTAYRTPTGNDWTAASLESAQIGLTATTTRDVWVTALWALVEYNPAGNDAATGGDAGGTYATAVTLAGKGEIQGYISSSSDVDYYTFSATDTNRYEVVLTPPPGKNYDVDIRNASDSSKATGTSSSDTEEIVKFTADSTGTWAVKVYSAGTDSDSLQPYTMSVYDANYYYVRQDGSGGQKNGDPTNSAQCFSTINGALTTLKTDYSNKISNQGKVFITVRDITAGTYPACTLDVLTTDIDGILVLENYSTEAPVINGTTGPAITVGNASQADGNVTNLIIKGLTLKATMASYNVVLFIGTNLTQGNAIIKNNIFDGQTSENGTVSMLRIDTNPLNLTIKNNEFKNYYDDNDSASMIALRRADTTYNPTVIFSDNTIHACWGGTLLYVGYASTGTTNFYVERNQIYNNRTSSSSTQNVGLINVASYNTIAAATQQVQVVRNNFIYNNDSSYSIHPIIEAMYASNTKIYNNTLYLNKLNSIGMALVFVDGNSTQGVEVKNNIFVPTAGNSSTVMQIAGSAIGNFISANNAFYVDYAGDGYPSGSDWATSENTENVGKWASVLKTTSDWNAISNNTGNGFTFSGPGVTSSSDMHLAATSLCIKRGVPLSTEVAHDFDRDPRPLDGSNIDIGGDQQSGGKRSSTQSGSQGYPAIY